MWPQLLSHGLLSAGQIKPLPQHAWLEIKGLLQGHWESENLPKLVLTCLDCQTFPLSASVLWCLLESLGRALLEIPLDPWDLMVTLCAASLVLLMTFLGHIYLFMFLGWLCSPLCSLSLPLATQSPLLSTYEVPSSAMGSSDEASGVKLCLPRLKYDFQVTCNCKHPQFLAQHLEPECTQ